jgi:hypothetical protein
VRRWIAGRAFVEQALAQLHTPIGQVDGGKKSRLVGRPFWVEGDLSFGFGV